MLVTHGPPQWSVFEVQWAPRHTAVHDITMVVLSTQRWHLVQHVAKMLATLSQNGL